MLQGCSGLAECLAYLVVPVLRVSRAGRDRLDHLAHLDRLDARAIQASPAAPDSQVRRAFRDLEADLEVPVHKELLELQVGAVSVEQQAHLAALVVQVSLDRRDLTDNPDRLDRKGSLDFRDSRVRLGSGA